MPALNIDISVDVTVLKLKMEGKIEHTLPVLRVDCGGCCQMSGMASQIIGISSVSSTVSI